MSNITDTATDTTTKRAVRLLSIFATFPPYYRHGRENEHLRWLLSLSSLELDRVIRFFNAWRPLSRYQPQLLLLLASVFSDAQKQKTIIMGNAVEEGGWTDGHDPHWALLDDLIVTLGGTPVVLKRSEELMVSFLNGLRRPMSEAYAVGILAGIENPALDISDYFREVVRLTGRSDLLESNLYLSIHVKVEPLHIIDTHEMALEYMARGPQERAEVLAAFKEVMLFWSEFWNAAFNDLMDIRLAS
ncbi:MAG TPA: iron-containing redox enzyme family protein [Thermoanaerobaculia bacterium]|nr:iron-containing redox enzyme family protein [Thermoanaerobaculia bacterium]